MPGVAIRPPNDRRRRKVDLVSTISEYYRAKRLVAFRFESP